MHSQRTGWIAIAVLLACTCGAPAFADCTLPSTPNDGYFDQTWTGKGCITFVGDNRNATTTSEVQKVVVTSSGNLFLAGDTSSGNGSWWAGQLTPQGAFDTTFGDTDSSGRITGCQMFLPGGCPTDSKFDFLPQADGKILVLSNDYLARTNAGAHAFDTAGVAGGTGHVDPEFQIATPSGTLNGNDNGALAFTPGGSLLVAGWGYQSMVAVYALEGVAQLNANLTLDTGFHATTETGVVYAGGEFVATGDTAEAHQILIQSTGRIVLVGEKGYDIRLSRLNTDGTVDTTFGTNGTTIESAVPSPCAIPTWEFRAYRSAAIDRGDRILVTGECWGGSSYITVVVRFTADGAVDASFGDSGFYVSASFGACPSLNVRPRALAIDSAGRILVGGTCDTELAVQRLRGDKGILDTTFGIDGLGHGRFDPTSNSDEVDSIVFDRSGHPVIAGRTQPSSHEQAGVGRLTYDLIYTNDFEATPRGCQPPDCN